MQVVVRRDGSDTDLTVDPTPFSVVVCSNPRHRTGTRLLLVYENTSTDAAVEPWPGNQIDYTEGSRHLLTVQGRVLSGWVTMVSKEEVANLQRLEQPSAAPAAAPAPAPAAEDEAVEVQSLSWIEKLVEIGQVYTVCAKSLPVRSGCAGVNTEKIGTIKSGTPVKLLETRATEDYGLRAYVSTLPGEVVMYTCALNEFNHSVHRLPSLGGAR